MRRRFYIQVLHGENFLKWRNSAERDIFLALKELHIGKFLFAKKYFLQFEIRESCVHLKPTSMI